MEIEIWKYVPGTIYQVSNLGNIRNINTWRQVTTVDRKGYRRFKISGRHVSVHRLVAEAFIPNHKQHPIVNHIDGNKANNHWRNLEWVTHSENQLHAIRTGLKKPIKKKEPIEKFHHQNTHFSG